MTPEEKAQHIVARMFDNDPFSQWLGIERLEVGPGRCTLRMQVRGEMLNGFRIAHGGISYSLADSALAFASNSRGKHALSVETSISHTLPLREGDILTATATEDHLSQRIGLYRVEVKNQNGELTALFKGVVYRKNTDWEV